MATLLIVGERQDEELALEHHLKQKGFSVRLLNESTNLVKFLSGGGIDAVVMDMNMPDMDGCEATYLVKADTTVGSIPVILCASHPAVGDEERARSSGADGFLTKPIDITLLQAILESFFPRMIPDPITTSIEVS
jgi:two-component system, cell cycle response regulator DivK